LNSAFAISCALGDGGGGNCTPGVTRAIEFDVSYDYNNLSAKDENWFVTHDFWAIYAYTPTLSEWLAEFKTRVADKTDFSALFVDLKTPNDGDLNDVLQSLTNYVPTNVAVILCMQGFENVTTDTNGWHKILDYGLPPNYGISVWIDNAAQVEIVWKQMHTNRWANYMMDIGQNDGFQDSCAREANKACYRDISDPYRIKKTMIWTQSELATMMDRMCPTYGYRSDAQIVGDQAAEYLCSWSYCYTWYFAQAATSAYPTTQRPADRSDIVSFWDRSQADYVSGHLLHINNDPQITLGARQTGAKWQPFTNLVDAAAASLDGGTNIIYPGTYYNGVARITKPLRIVKSADAGLARLTN